MGDVAMANGQGRLAVYDTDSLKPLYFEAFLIGLTCFVLIWQKAEAHPALALVAALVIAGLYLGAYQTRAFYLVAALSTAFWTFFWGSLANSATHDKIWTLVVGAFACLIAIGIHLRARDFIRNVDMR